MTVTRTVSASVTRVDIISAARARARRGAGRPAEGPGGPGPRSRGPALRGHWSLRVSRPVNSGPRLVAAWLPEMCERRRGCGPVAECFEFDVRSWLTITPRPLTSLPHVLEVLVRVRRDRFLKLNGEASAPLQLYLAQRRRRRLQSHVTAMRV